MPQTPGRFLQAPGQGEKNPRTLAEKVQDLSVKSTGPLRQRYRTFGQKVQDLFTKGTGPLLKRYRTFYEKVQDLFAQSPGGSNCSFREFFRKSRQFSKSPSGPPSQETENPPPTDGGLEFLERLLSEPTVFRIDSQTPISRALANAPQNCICFAPLIRVSLDNACCL